MRYVLLLSICSLCLALNSASNIVVYMPIPFYSHQITFKPLWLELARRGHHLTLIQSDEIIKNNENVTHIVLNETYTLMNDVFDKLGSGGSILTIFSTSLKTFEKVATYQLTHPEVQKLVKGEKKTDLVFTECLATFGIYLGKLLNAPVICVISMDATIIGHSAVGNPMHPALYPDKDVKVSPVMTFQERITSVVFWFSLKVLNFFILAPIQEKCIKQCFGEIDPIDEVVKNISMLFINANPLFNTVRPLGPKTINIGGGAHLMKPQPLPKDLQEYLDRSKHGVIYFSLGSSITGRQISQSTKSAIVETFSQLPYDILWKLDEIPSGLPENVKIMKWLPQQDVLRHKNIKLFITQGGLQSMEEAIFSYVPMVALPFYGDQPNNANKMVSKGFGLMLDHTRLDVKTFKEAILEVINNSSYKTRTKELADLVMDQPMTGLEKAVWWTEYVLRHGHTDHFRNPSIDIPLYQYLLLDVISFILLVTLVTIYAVIKILQVLKWVLSKLFRKISGATKVKVH